MFELCGVNHAFMPLEIISFNWSTVSMFFPFLLKKKNFNLKNIVIFFFVLLTILYVNKAMVFCMENDPNWDRLKEQVDLDFQHEQNQRHIDNEINHNIAQDTARRQLDEIIRGNNPRQMALLRTELERLGQDVQPIIDNVEDDPLPLRERIRGYETLLLFIGLSTFSYLCLFYGPSLMAYLASLGTLYLQIAKY